MLLDESVLSGLRLYRPGEGFAGAPLTERDRSGTGLDKDRVDSNPSALPSSLATCWALARERLDEPEVETVESEEEEG